MVRMYGTVLFQRTCSHGQAAETAGKFVEVMRFKALQDPAVSVAKCRSEESTVAF